MLVNTKTTLRVSVTRRGKKHDIGVLSGGNWFQRLIGRVRLAIFNMGARRK